MLNDVMTTQEAGELWGLASGTIKLNCTGQKGYPPRFTDKECAKSGKNWLVTYEGMVRLYGEPKNNVK